MGIDLTLAFLNDAGDLAGSTACVHEELSFDRNYEIFAQFKSFSYCDDEKRPAEAIITPEKIPPHLWIRFKNGKETRVDPFGSPLHFIYVADLKRIVLPENASWKNRAIMAYVRELPDRVPVILKW